MFTPEDALHLITRNGLWVMAPIAVVEGPIVTVVAAWLASLGLLRLPAVIAVAIVADLLGDALLYALGRSAPQRLRARLGLRQDRLARLSQHFDRRGASTLVLGKLTHSAGAAVLVAAGMARMPFGAFLWWNLVATLPKSLAFVALGWSLGGAHARIGEWISTGSLLLLAGLLAVGAVLWRRRLSA